MKSKTIFKIVAMAMPVAAAMFVGVEAIAAGTNAEPKTVRVMAIGNSFSRDAMTHLPMIVRRRATG